MKDILRVKNLNKSYKNFFTDRRLIFLYRRLHHRFLSELTVPEDYYLAHNS